MFIALRRRKQKNWGYLAFSWEEFSLLGNSDCELPPKQSSTVCQIIYSGMTGEPKGIFVTNAALMSEVLSTNHILFLTDRGCTEEDSYFFVSLMAHTYDQIIESYCIYTGSSMSFWQGGVRFYWTTFGN